MTRVVDDSHHDNGVLPHVVIHRVGEVWDLRAPNSLVYARGALGKDGKQPFLVSKSRKRTERQELVPGRYTNQWPRGHDAGQWLYRSAVSFPKAGLKRPVGFFCRDDVVRVGLVGCPGAIEFGLLFRSQRRKQAHR